MTGGELLIVFLGLVAVAIVGFVVGRATSSGSGQSHKLEQELKEAKEAHDSYKQEVNTHFEKTAELFKDMTGAYRSLYNHMAESSGKLGVGPSDPLLEADPARQEQTRLDYGTADAETDETAPAPERPADYAPEETPEEKKGQQAQEGQAGTRDDKR